MPQDNDRPDLSGERADLDGGAATPASRVSDPTPTPAPPRGTAPANTGGFDFNQPTIITLLYLGGYLTGISALVGVVLAYVWRSEPKADWERSHYDYLIRTFWIGVLGTIVGVILTVILIGMFVLLAVAVLVLVRTVMSLIAAQKQQPMPDPDSWLI